MLNNATNQGLLGSINNNEERRDFDHPSVIRTSYFALGTSKFDIRILALLLRASVSLWFVLKRRTI